MIKIAVLDSQEQSISQIKEITKKCMLLFDINYELRLYRKPEDLYNDLQEKAFDIFLLSTECHGIEVACRIRKEDINSVIIYITYHVDYAPREFEINPYRYISQNQLNEKLPEAYRALCDQIEKRKNGEMYYTLKNKYTFRRILYHEIYYLKKERNYVWLIHKYGQNKLEKVFDEILNEFTDKKSFAVIGKKYIINILHVMYLKEYQVYFRDGNFLSVNRGQLEQIRKAICDYWKADIYENDK